MATLRKRLLILFSIPLVLLLVAIVLAVILVDADDIKQRLDSELVAQTGQHLKIDGDASLQLWPLAIKVSKAQLRSEGKKQPWFRVERIAGQIDLIHLFSGQLVIDSFIIDKPEINLVHARFPEAKGTPKPTAKKRQPGDAKEAAPLLIGVRQIKISNGTLNWDKKPEDGQLDINSLSAHNKAPGKPVDFRFDVVAHSPAVPHAVPVKGSMVIDFSKTDVLKIKPINIKLDQSEIDGKLSINSKKGTRIDFDFDMDQLDVDRYTQPAGKRAAKPADKPAATTAKKSTAPSDTVITGKLALKKLSVTGLNITNTKTKLRFANDVLKLTGFSSNVSDGTVKGNVSVNLKGTQPAISLEQKLSGIKVGKLLKDLKIYDHFTGKGNVDLKLSTRGNDLDPLLKNLNGKVGFKLTESSFNDFDLLATAKKAENLYRLTQGKKLSTDKPARSKKVYDVIKGELEFKKGIGTVKNTKLARTDAHIVVRNIILPGYDKMDLYYDVYEYKDGKATGKMIPLRHKGKLSKPSMPKLDSKAVKKAIKKEAKKKLKKELKKEKEKALKKGLERLFNR